MSVVEIENAVGQLSPQEFDEFERWFDQARARKWDNQIEEDSENGNLDRILKKLVPDIEKEDLIPLDTFLNNEKFS